MKLRIRCERDFCVFFFTCLSRDFSLGKDDFQDMFFDTPTSDILFNEEI